jgi:hypothetical protein
MSYKVGKVVGYLEKLGMALVELQNDLVIGEKIKFVLGRDELFVQKVEIIQKDHKKIDAARPNDVIGLKTDEKVEMGTEIYKVL